MRWWLSFLLLTVGGCNCWHPQFPCDGVQCKTGDVCHPVTGVCLPVGSGTVGNSGVGGGSAGGDGAGVGGGGTSGVGGGLSGVGGGLSGVGGGMSGVGGGVGGGTSGVGGGTAGVGGGGSSGVGGGGSIGAGGGGSSGVGGGTALNPDAGCVAFADGGRCLYAIPPTEATSCFGDAGCPGTAGSAACGNTPWCGQDSQYPARARTFQTQTVAGNTVIRDSRTGLTWTKTFGGPFDFFAAQNHCANLSFAGLTSWRVPSNVEMHSLIVWNNNPVTSPLFDLPPPAQPSFFTSTTGPGGPCFTAQLTIAFNTYYPLVGVSCQSGSSYFVRCVHGPAWLGQDPSRFVTEMRQGDRVVRDLYTGLEWQGGPERPATDWMAGLAGCEASAFGGSTDWRLPDAQELVSLDRRYPDLGGGSGAFPTLFLTSTWVPTYGVVGMRGTDNGFIPLSPMPGVFPPLSYSLYTRCVRLGR